MRKLKNSELNRLDKDAYKRAEKIPLAVVLDNVRSSHNIGSVFRTADAFRVEKIWLCGITATPPHAAIRKTALGATETVDWEYAEDTNTTIRELKAKGFVTIAIEQTENAIMLNDFYPEKNKKYALVFGHEIKGVSQEVVSGCDMAIEIPQHGTKHSLNISVSAGIVIWDFFNKIME